MDDEAVEVDDEAVEVDDEAVEVDDEVIGRSLKKIINLLNCIQYYNECLHYN